MIKNRNINLKITKAFTLAEILIVTFIIGVIAVMTISPLLKKQQEQASIVTLKKGYSVFVNAFNIAVQQNSTPENWNLIGSGSNTGAINLLNILSPYMQFNGSFTPEQLVYNRLDGIIYTDSTYVTGYLNDGTSLKILIRDQNCSQVRGGTLPLGNVCALAVLDTNGNKTPNKAGYDIFWFNITKYGIIPQGSQSETNHSFAECNRSSYGWGCAAWVIQNDNMDYLYCDDLSWTGKKKCS